MADEICTAPSAEDFLATFGVEPSEARPRDGGWTYTCEDEDGGRLRFSFNTHERSVQTCFEMNGRRAWTVVHESVERVWIDDRERICASFTGDLTVKLTVQVFPQLEVEWSALRG
jgi:hypothetical protein